MESKDYVADRREYDSRGRQVRHSGGWAILRWDAGRAIYLEPGSYYGTKAEALAVLREERERSKAAAVLGRKGGLAGRGASQRRPLSSERAREIRAKRRWYGIVALPDGSRLCADERQLVLSFRTLADRDRWLALGVETDTHPVYRYLRTHGEERREATRDEALATLREIQPGSTIRSLAEIAPWPETYDETR